MTTPEARVKAKVSALLRSVKQLWYNMPVPSGFGHPNLDYNVCVRCKFCNRGLFLAIETKKPGGKPTPQQEATIQRLRDAGAAVLVIDGDLSELEEWLEQKWTTEL